MAHCTAPRRNPYGAPVEAALYETFSRASWSRLRDATPPGYRAASAGESEPAPGDLAALQEVLRSHAADVLIYNTQTSGALPEQIRRTAEDAGVPVVEVSESVPPDQPGFVAWQLDQLRRLRAALGQG